MARFRRIALIGLSIVIAGGAAAAMLGSRPSTGPCLDPAATAQRGPSTTFTPYRVSAADGNCLQAYEWKPANAPVRGAVVIVHGIHDHARRYDRLARALNEAGIAVYAQDHRGHSTSGGARQRVDSIAQLVGDVDLAVQEAARRNPGAPLFLHGHSMGGLVVARYAIDHAKRTDRQLAGAVISSAALKLPPTASAGSRAVVGALSTLAPGLGVEAVDEAKIVRDAGARGALANDPVVSREKLPSRTVATILGGIVDIQQRLEEIAIPVLILHGTADRVTEPDGSNELAKRARSTDKTLKLYPGALHDLLHEPEGPEVMREIIAFVSARLPR